MTALRRNLRAFVGAAVLTGTAASAQGGSIEGRATFVGKKPAAVELPRGTDPFCAKQKMTDPSVLIGPDGKGLANVLVRVVAGAPDAAPPAQPVRVQQEACMYLPRVQGAVLGQKVEVANADATLHNVRAQEGAKSVFNVAQPPKAPPVQREVPPTEVLKLKCDVHPWMTGYVIFNRNPHFAVTDASGKFTLPELPPGHYRLEAWHEQLGTQRAEVDLVAGKPAQAQFRFSPQGG